MSMLQASLRTLAGEPRPLTEIAERLNRMILQSRESGRFATVFLGLFDPETQWLAYSNAGHNPPCLVRGDGGVEWLMEGGLLLGAFEDPLAREGKVWLAPGDRLVLYTDGITEAPSPGGDFFGEERLAAAVTAVPAEAPAEELVEAVLHSVRQFLDGGEPADDMTVVALRVPALVEAGV
jgi:sigma-B regulation protein RsbU (phosphoserine phosphatase)